MDIGNILTLYDYNYWASERILAAAEGVTEAQFTAPAKLSHGSLHATLVHIFSAEWIWRVRSQEGISPAGLPDEADVSTLDMLRGRWRSEEGLMRSFLAGLRDEDLSRKIRYTTTRGLPFENELWQILHHVVNHGTQHRGEAAVLLTEYGRSPGDLDFILYLRE
jgi:uncharacterized damage-inducible protein DinB